MIRYLCNEEINRDLWDACIGSRTGVQPYGLSWYLDIMAPGWTALVEDDYNAVFPLPAFKKYGICYIATPAFIQQLGVYSKAPCSVHEIDIFAGMIPSDFRLIDLCVGQYVSSDQYSVTERVNYELDLSESYDNLRKGFSTGCVKNLERSSRFHHRTENDIEPGELISLFIASKGKIIRKVKPVHYSRLKNLMEYCIRNQKGRITGVRNDSGNLIFGRFLLMTEGRITALFAANTPESRKHNIGTYHINEVIKEFSSTDTIFDFEGSSIPSIASFMESFGCSKNIFYRIYKNRLPVLLRYFR